MKVQYLTIGDIPQVLLDTCKDEFGMEILYLPELRSKVTGAVYAPQRDVLVIKADWQRYCPSCDEYVDPVVEAQITWVSRDSMECLWDEVGEVFCPNHHCRETYFTDSPEQADEYARESYDSDRADAIRKGE